MPYMLVVNVFFYTKCPMITTLNRKIQDYQICYWICIISTVSNLFWISIKWIHLWVVHSVLRILHRRSAFSSVYSTGALSLSSTKAWVENSSSRVFTQSQSPLGSLNTSVWHFIKKFNSSEYGVWVAQSRMCSRLHCCNSRMIKDIIIPF